MSDTLRLCAGCYKELTDEPSSYCTDCTRSQYRKALLRLADLVCDLTPGGESAFREQEKLCQFWHDQVYFMELESTGEGTTNEQTKEIHQPG